MEEIKGDPHRAAAQIIATAEGFPLELETAWIYREIEERLPKALVGVLQDRAAENLPLTGDHNVEAMVRTLWDVIRVVEADWYALLGCALGALMRERGSDDLLGTLRSVLPPPGD